MQPTTKLEAMGMVNALTPTCWMYLEQFQSTTGKRQAVALARFREVNETRVRLVEEWGLREFAARLIARRVRPARATGPGPLAGPAECPGMVPGRMKVPAG